MNILIPLLAASILLWMASRWYGAWLSDRLGVDPEQVTPAVTINDGRDYVPTNPNVVFAHHFASIAGAGPIVGPTMALLFGVLPVWLWIVVGAVFIGGVHDFTTLYLSLRERGRSIAEITRTVLGERGFALFIGLTLVMLILVTSSFLAMTAVSLTSRLPLELLRLDENQRLLRVVMEDGVAKGVIGGIASTSVVIISALSPILGWLIFRRRIGSKLAYSLAACICVASIMVGHIAPIQLEPHVWQIIIGVYVLIAAGVPVWLLLQPRDFINVQILYAGIAVLVTGILVTGFHGQTVQMHVLPASVSMPPLGAIWPMLFITVACGAISGFHALVATGTTSKQIPKERYARVVGYNGMLLEAVLAMAVLLVVGTFLSQSQYMQIVWPSEPGAKSNPILAFAFSVGQMTHQAFGLPTAYGTVFGILLVEGFAVTTLDVAVRLNRYLLEELWQVLFRQQVPALLRSPWVNALICVIAMLCLALTNGFQVLWPLFATGNQLLAAISLIAATAWLANARKPTLFTLIPAVFMLATTFASLGIQFMKFGGQVLQAWRMSPMSLVTTQLGASILLIVDAVLFALGIGVLLLCYRSLRPGGSQHRVSTSLD